MVRGIAVSTFVMLGLAAAPAAAAPPEIVSIKTQAGALLDRVTTIEVTAKSGSAAINSVSVREPGVPGGFGESACRGPRAVGGTPAKAGPLRPGRETTFTVPYLPATAGLHVLEVTVTAGDCGPRTETTTSKLQVHVTLPSTPPLPGGSSGGGGLVPGLPVVGGGGPLARASQAGACAGADETPTAANVRQLRLATVCLVNAQRTAAGLSRLKSHVRLKKSAAGHAADMIARRFFAHDAPDGPDLAARVKKVRFWPALATENLGTGTGVLATPRAMVDAWMNSEGHRFNILDSGVRNIGVAVVYRMYTGDEPGATYVANFGRRY